MLPRFHEHVNMLILRVGASMREESLRKCYIKALRLKVGGGGRRTLPHRA